MYIDKYCPSAIINTGWTISYKLISYKLLLMIKVIWNDQHIFQKSKSIYVFFIIEISVPFWPY